MKLGDGARTFDVRRTGAATFEIDGRVVSATVSRDASGRVRIVFGNGSAAHPRVLVAERGGDLVFVADGARTRAYQIRSRASTAHHHGGEGSLESPMPGRIVKVCVATGDRVHRGQELVVIEAMKMENALTAPFDGVVTRLAARVGDMASAGAILIEIEDPEDGGR